MASFRLVFYILFTDAALAGKVKEYVAMGPSDGGSGSTKLQWVAVEYPQGVSSANDVSLSVVSNSVPELGSWFGLDTEGLALTAKIVGDTMYALYDESQEGAGGGCCADQVRIYKRDGRGKYTVMPLTAAVQKALNSTSAHVSHTFDVTTLHDGTFAGLFQVKYLESAFGTDYGDAIVALKIPDATIIKTVDGASAFEMYRDAGTMSTVRNQSRFKIQNYVDSSTSGSGGEQFHGNGVLRFTAKSGISYLAFTHRFDSEAVIFKDPFTYASKEGGGKIVQRFGTPSVYNEYGVADTRHFGLKSSASAFTGGVHNVFYTASSASLGGKESISLFVNAQDSMSHAYEFAVSPVEEGSQADTGDDTVFNVDYVFAKCTFDATSQGGARTIGNGVFIVMGGQAGIMEVVDKSGTSKVQKYLQGGQRGLYDPFIRVVATTPLEIVV